MEQFSGKIKCYELMQIKEWSSKNHLKTDNPFQIPCEFLTVFSVIGTYKQGKVKLKKYSVNIV